jgi:hypothetical protein
MDISGIKEVEEPEESERVVHIYKDDLFENDSPSMM